MALLCSLLAAPPAAQAFGPAGHAIAGLAAEPLLCREARASIDEIADGASLAEIGRWADWVRSEPEYAHTGPWHYVNVPDDGSIASHRHPPEGDVLWAIEHFTRRLAEPRLTRAERLEALRFLTHFIADLHQPLHVGRESDRGGNRIDIVHEGETLNLHRFWDGPALGLDSAGVEGYVERLRPLARRLAAESEPGAPADWAAESLELRPWVYRFNAQSRELGPDYVARAEALSRMRLAQAAVRIAATLNELFCSSR